MPDALTSSIATPPGAARAATDVPPPPQQDPRARILIVDDNEKNLLAVRNVIDDLADVEVASSGEGALRHLLKGEFAVILLDVFMPGMDGYETAQFIRQRPQSRRIPIIFLSAVNKEKDHLMRGYAMGAVDYVFKPVEPIVLRSKVAVFVDLYEKTREIERKARHEQQLLDVALAANAERLRVGQELRAAEHHQAAIIEALPILFYVEPPDAIPHIPQFVGGDFASMTGFDPASLAADPDLWRQRLHPDDRVRVADGVANRRETHGFAIEYRWQCADGRYKHFLDHAVQRLDDEGRPDGYAGTVLDVSDRKHLESQLSHAWKMDAIGQLTGGIAHDFNNLLAAVLGGLSLIERRLPVTEDQRRILMMARRAAEQGTELVRRLLAFARRQQLVPDRIVLGHLSASVRDLLAHTLGGLVSLEWIPDETIWSPFADESQLELALVNLVINARDAMPDGGVVTIRGRNADADEHPDLGLAAGSYVVLSVEDHGAGIAAEHLSRVMDPFFTTKEVGKGTGLGLSMVYGFATQSGGAVHIDSEFGRGTTVQLWLPRAPEVVRLAPPVRPPAPCGAHATGGAPLRILLADDHPGVRATTAYLLADFGHDVVEAAAGPEALATLVADPRAFDVLITDYAMPGMSGAELIRQARQLRADLPAIIVTGYVEVESLAARPADVEVLVKPFDGEALSSLLERVVGQPRPMAAR